MSGSFRFCSLVVLRLLAISGLFLMALPASAQPGMNLTGASNCTAADFDTTVQFLNGPGDSYSIVVNKRNLASHPCVFDGPMYGPSIVPDRLEGDKPFGLCYFCDERLPNGQVPMTPPLSLNPGEVAQQTFRWKTTPPNDSVRCLQPQWIAGPILLVTPSLFRPICSEITVTRFRLAPPQDSSSPQSQISQPNQPQAFELRSERSRYYSGENFSVELSPIQASPAVTPTAGSCPTFYLRERSPDGATRIDEVRPIASKGCPSFMPGRRPINSESSFELDSGANSRWMGPGEHSLEVWQLVSAPDDTQVRFVSSNILRVELADPTTMARRWGTKVQGIATDVTLDKDTYRVGENIPLHMAVEDFDAPVTIYSWDPLWDPCMTVGVQVLGSDGHPLAQSERFSGQSICMGHGFGPRPITKGTVIPIERTLVGEGWLPNHPGTYTIIVRWSPCAGKKVPASGVAQNLKPYALVEARATIHIVGDEATEHAPGAK